MSLADGIAWEHEFGHYDAKFSENDYESKQQFLERTRRIEMPCVGPTDAECRAMDADRVSTLNELLCSACRSLSRLSYDFEENPQLSKWWDRHKKEDAKRLLKAAKEAMDVKKIGILAKKPLNKLTVEDKALLKKYGII